MATKTEITLSKDGYFIHVKTVGEGSNRRYTLAPQDPQGNPADLTAETPEVKAACLEAWTDEVKEAYQAHMEASI